MTKKEKLFQELSKAQIPFEQDAPTAPLVSMKAGGPAWALCRPNDQETLQKTLKAAQTANCDALVIGGGANLLIRDGGFFGVVIVLGEGFAQLEDLPDGSWFAGAALPLRRLVERATKEGREKLAFLGGIPGTVGGAVVMNAGTDLGEMCSVIQTVRLMHKDGSVEERPKASMGFRYRHSDTPEGSVILGATLDPGPIAQDPEKFRELMKTRAEKRRRSQPVQLPTSGSTFTNPKGDFAGRLIEACGLKGRQVGGAQISTIHANFIVNPERKASCANIIELIEIAKRSVFEKFAISLDLEVRVLGEDGEANQG